jgi:hypothetical protein
MERVMTSNRNWLQPPSVVAPSPHDKSKTVRYAISESYIRTLLSGNRLTQIFQVWAHVVGELPPINNVSRLGRGTVRPSLTTMAQSVACFRGVKRPYDDEEEGDSVLVYVLNPPVSIDRDVSLVCLAKAVRVPSDTCLTVQVKPTAALHPAPAALNSDVTRSFDDAGAEAIHGELTRLEFISGNGETPILPERYSERYHQRLW